MAERDAGIPITRAPSLSQTGRPRSVHDAGAPDADQPTQGGDSKPTMDAAMPVDAAMAEPAQTTSKPAPSKMEASGGAPMVATGAAGAAGAMRGNVAGSGAGVSGSTGMPQAGGAAPSTTKQTLIGVLNEHAAMNGADALVTRALVTQIDTPLPANAASLRLLLGTAVTGFGCPQMNPRECAAICKYVADSCLICVADQECRGQLVLVCPNALTKCLP